MKTFRFLTMHDFPLSGEDIYVVSHGSVISESHKISGIESLWRRTEAEIGTRITEASSLPALRSVFDERFRYYNRERRSSIGYIPPRGHLGQPLDTLDPQIAAASWPN